MMSRRPRAAAPSGFPAQRLVEMIEFALKRVYGEGASDLVRVYRKRRRLDLTIAVGSLLVAFVIMPIVYAALLVDAGFRDALSGASLDHLLLNAAGNAVVMVCAIRLNGRFDRKLAAILTRTLIVHGMIAFWLLVARQPYSNQVMLMATAGSAVLGALVALIKHRTMEVRAAVLGAWHPLVEQVDIPCDIIDDPDASLSPYDVLLTASVTDMSPEWATAISRAMLMGKQVRLLAEFIEESHGIVSLEHFDLEHLPEAGLTSYRTRKRLMDISLVLLSLPVAVPLLLMGASLVKVTMGGPVIFIQGRVGLGGRTFRMFKLRTMQMSADKGEKATSGRDDIRITPVGRWLRRFRIDELPQLWNVLIGDMSVIGPRPEWTVLSDSYAERLPAYAYRHLVRPGITGWAQVRGGYAADLAETRTKVGYDLFYIKNLSFSLDIQILVRTIWTLLSGSGAR
jgi:lipopolysaccharide/colanic/teichoic acid biosynthesis glycosyltransferase